MQTYLTRLLVVTLCMVLGTIAAAYFGHRAVISAVWLGLGFLTALTVLIHWFIFGQKGTENAVIRRMMVGSMMRIFLGVIFLAITLYNIRPVNLFFVVSYCLYFSVFLVFEISQMRTNLRPDLKRRPKNENA